MPNLIQPSPEQWDSFVAAQPRAHILQLAAWGELKAAYGWSVERVALAEGSQIVAGAQLLFRRLPFRLGSLAYLAMGPYPQPLPLTPSLNSERGQTGAAGSDGMRRLWQAVDACARRHHAAFLKWEPGIIEASHDSPAELGFRESAQTIQPPRTILIEIGDDDETILARMNQGTRRKIRQSLKNGVRYWQASRAEVDIFNGMMQTTGARNAFGVHAPGYYERAYDLFVPSGQAALILAEHEGDPLAGIMVFAVGRTAWYLYGASSDTKRNLMAAYGVQWEAIRWAKARGCTVYDMWGIPDEDETTLEASFQERSDGLWGVYGFKRGWGGRVARSLGAWDKVYNPLVYNAYKAAVRLRSSGE
ncbi:MAG: peptidoglycan bridge formation glycyltransferase FemA/FemB family protein [Chloroflexi bacterium]|nr:peptidoglycan bridge formation glycyltransferase FemA/FemB family protein [Chloroflexota bacterium]MDL1883304.1 peptidoglycan bridge formation glycyltransferase FemA/FemB family protein [Anaerolineae bacterium CFX8]